MRRIGFVLVLVGMLLAVACQPEIESHTVKILGLDGPLEKEVVHGGEFHLPAAPEKEGHTFDCITGGIEGHSYTPDTDIVVESDLTLTYNWKINRYSVKVLDGNESVIDDTYDYGSKITLYDEEPPYGYHFVNVTDENGDEYPLDEEITVTEDLLLTYNWEANEYKVHIIISDDVIHDIPVKHGETFTPERKTRSGYIFQNIKDEEGAQHEVGVAIPVTSDLTLTYNWKSDSEPLAIGDTGPAGGMIFYVDEGNEYPEWDYLETSTGKEGIGKYQFGFYFVDGSLAVVGTEPGVGTGKRNTEKLVAAMGDAAWDSSGNRTVSEYAAKMADGYEQNGYDDWFLPSKDELNLVYQNLQKPGLSGFSGSWCWSSSENSNYYRYAWRQDFGGGNPYDVDRLHYCCVRPVRAF